MVVRHGRADLVGKRGSVDAAMKLLEQLPLLQTCDFASRLNAILQNESDTSPAVQKQLMHQLLGTKATGVVLRLDRYVARDRASGRTTRRVVFEELPVLAAVRVAALSAAPDTGKPGADAHIFGNAVINVNDVIERHTRFPAAPSLGGPGDQWTWAYYIFVNALSRYDEWEIHALPRAFEVVFRKSAACSSSPYFVDVEALLREKLGIGASELWTIIFVLQSHYRSFTAANVAETNAAIDLKKAFESDVRFQPSEYEPILAHLSIDVAAFREEVKARYSSTYLGYFDVGRFYATPFIRFGDMLVAPSVRLLLAKLSFGLHHTIMFAVPGPARRKYLQLIGESFEAYVAELIQRIAVSQASSCLLEADLQKAASPRSDKRESVADGVIFDDTTLVVWDAKSRTASAEVYAGNDLRAFQAWYSDLINEVASQCAHTVSLQLAGAFEAIGLDRRPRKVVAVLIPYVPIVRVCPFRS